MIYFYLSLLMMARIFFWIKSHKVTSLLLVIVLYFLFTKYFQQPRYPIQTTDFGAAMKVAPGRSIGGFSDIVLPPQEAPPAPEATNRLVVQESYLSLLVKKVVEAQKKIIQTAEDLGGYMVNSNLNNPQDAPTATVVVRVPSSKLQQALEAYRVLAVKVISENLNGQDVTDEFVDNEARLATLLKTKAKFAEILDKATAVQDILNVQREIINLQSQIDSIKGQQNFLEKNAQMAKLTIYLSTDELALPYAPSETWRPAVIFKQAVRSVISSLRKLATTIIWLAVYSIIWLPILLTVLFLRKRRILPF